MGNLVSFAELSEAAFQKKVLKFLGQLGLYFFKVMKSSRSGTPDIVICMRGRFIGVEVKRETGELEPLQKMHALEIKKNKGLHFCVRPSNFELFKSEIELLLQN